ncbi:MAG: Ldh family oxidoreductase [Veillonella sp.]|nr:Ldh family oxidoreductase [Veillonella sp.]
MADAKNTVLFPYETLKKLSMDAFQKFGFSEKEADIIQDVLLTSDLFGIQSHGMQRMVRYHKGITNGLIKIDAKPEIVKETPISAVIDGHDGMGQLLGHKAMEMAIEKAKKSGVGIVSVRNSNHYGIAGYYAKMASDQGLIGFSCTNSDTVVTRGKLEMYNKMGKATPDGWAVNKDGVPSTDAAEVLGNISRHEGGGILPLGGATEVLGGHKGYGNGMIAELFSSILSQGGTSNKCMVGGKSNICHGFMAINPEFFGDPAEIKKHFSQFLQELREAPKAQGQDRIYTHGEKEHESVEKVKAEGIPVLNGTMLEVQDLCNELGLDFKSYFGDYVPEAPATMFKGNY